MPSKPSTHIFVLVEDKEQQNLIRRFLVRSGLDRGVRFQPLPSKSDGGAGEKFVRDRFPGVLKQLRSSMGSKVGAVMIAMIDADTETVAARRARLPGADADDPVVILVPKRHVETWIGALNGHPVDEATDYKRDFGDSAQIRVAAAKLFECTRPNTVPPDDFPPSLKAAIPEWQKVH